MGVLHRNRTGVKFVLFGEVPNGSGIIITHQEVSPEGVRNPEDFFMIYLGVNIQAFCRNRVRWVNKKCNPSAMRISSKEFNAVAMNKVYLMSLRVNRPDSALQSLGVPTRRQTFSVLT